MLKALSRAGLGNVGPMETYVRKAGEYGFQGVEAGDLAGWLAQAGETQAATLLAETGVAICSFGLPVEWRHDEAQFRAGLPRLAAEAEAAARLGCTRCCTYVLPSTDYPPAAFTVTATRRLRACAAYLRPYGIRLALEFVGPHHLRTRWKHPFLLEMSEMLEWADAIGEPNVGLLLDAYHWYTTGGTVQDLLALDASRIVHVHLNDAPPVPVGEALDNGRLYPGEGVIDLKGFLGALQTIGYDGYVAQEILTVEPPSESSEALLARSAEAFRRVYEEAGIR
ncbi:sugar phosphate isomerase [Paenibacillus sp. J31TS4]|uniref:sugar phosphate isomerase/epimerase family protein n=1 Tax=Paenibacillus sp. J31TS4 TaxID=2807195 RepID=UPI001B2A6268|nr:sugar phosphate isomerase/epimerase family protein [Paenibacillus sp. J31TS4]GIP37196.1 sugar phosphate isomerase [Paenibacillus sp. J31TS4]